MFYKDERMAVFIDGINLYSTVKLLGFGIDFKLLRQEFMKRGKLLRISYYVSVLESDEHQSTRPLLDWLDYNGYNVVSKAAREYIDGDGNRKVKGSINVDLAVQAMQLAPRLDHVVIFSGDGDLCPLVEVLQTQGVRVSLVSSIRTAPKMISGELRRKVDTFIELDELRDVIANKSPERIDSDTAQ